MNRTEFKVFYNEDGGKEFRKEIRDYFERRLYDGFTKHFELSTSRSFSFPIHCRADQNPVPVHIYPENLFDEDITDADTEWEGGLREIGNGRGIRLSLHSDLYTK